MSSHPPTSPPEPMKLFLDLPVRLYTALRTMRLYPFSNPQVQRSVDFVRKALQVLLEKGGDSTVTLTLAGHKILVCGEPLPDKDQARPQIQGLVTLLSRLNIHSFTFQPDFTLDDCVKFIQILAPLLDEKHHTESVTALLSKAGVTSVLVNAAPTVTVPQSHQTIRKEPIGSGLSFSDEKGINFIWERVGTAGELPEVPPHLIEALISRLPGAAGRTLRPENLAEAIVALLQHLNQETDLEDQANLIKESANTLSALDPTLLAQLASLLPATPIAGELLRSTLAQLTPPQLGSLLTNFVAQQTERSTPVVVTDPRSRAVERFDQAAWERMLGHYEHLLDNEQQAQLAREAGSQIAAMDGLALGTILGQTFTGSFGDRLYRQVIEQIADEQLEQLADLQQAIIEHQENLPPDLPIKAIEEAYTRLLKTVHGEKMRARIGVKLLKKKEQQEAIKTGVDRLLHGDLKVLEQNEVAQALPETISSLLRQGEEASANNLLMHLATALQYKAPLVQTNAVLSLASVAEQLDAIGQWQRLHKLLPALQLGLLHEGANEQSINQTIAAIGGLIRQSLTEKNYAQAIETTHLLRTLAPLEPSTAGYNPLVKEHALATLKSLCSQPFLEHLLDLYLHSGSQQKTAGRLLIDLGPESTRFQLQQLMRSESRFERKRLLTLIKRTGSPAITILLRELHREAPWFVIRNIIHLLGEIGNPTLLREIRPFIRHADLRVQQEVIKTAVQIGGKNLKNFLFVALQTVDDSLKVKVVHHLAAVADERFVPPLTELLESTKSFHGKNRDSLQLAICKTLGVMGSLQAAASLNRVAQSKKIFGLGGYSQEVRQAARLALEQIQKSPISPIKQEPEQKASLQGDKDLPAMPPAATPPSPIDEEAAIFTLATQGQRDSAKQRLLDLITATARTGDFQTAERLRERMYEIDPLALNEIIRAGEVIEQEKRGAIKEDDLEIWAELTDRLSSEEFSTMYHEFSEHRYQTEETIVNQGDKNDALFFITQGSVKVSSRVGQREIFITSLNRGQIAGENFFTPSFWTVSLTALTPVRVYILQQAALTAWREKFPGLRAKLSEYYNSCNNIRSMLKKKGLERRKGQRFSLARKIQIQPITNLDAPIGQGFRAELIDISAGGLAFIIRISKQENARLLLGRRLQVVLPVGGKVKYLYLKGLVVSIQPFHILENDFSVHFRFDHPMEQQGLQTILG